MMKIIIIIFKLKRAIKNLFTFHFDQKKKIIFSSNNVFVKKKKKETNVMKFLKKKMKFGILKSVSLDKKKRTKNKQYTHLSNGPFCSFDVNVRVLDVTLNSS